jgi:opacity protein-like surface antigen
MAMLKEKITYPANSGFANVSSKQKNNFAYSLTAGLSAEVGTGVNADLAYSWRDFSKTKAKVATAGTTNYRGHNLSVAFRFDI